MAVTGVRSAAVWHGPRWGTPPVIVFNSKVLLYKARAISWGIDEVWCERTKSSSAADPLVKVSFLGEAFMVADMSTRSFLRASLLNSASKVDRKGLRDMGLLAELERSDWLAGEGKPGEVALLRKGLLEDRLRDRPGDGRRSAVDKVSEQERDRSAGAPNFVTARSENR